MYKTAVIAEVWVESEQIEVLHFYNVSQENSFFSPKEMNKGVTQVYKTFKREHTVPEGHFQNCWQTVWSQQTGAKQANFSTESENGLNGESPLHSSVINCIFLLSQYAESDSKAFNAPLKSIKLLGLVSQTIYCWWHVRKPKAGRKRDALALRGKKKKENKSRQEKQLGFQATYYNWLPLDNPFLPTN